MANVIFEEINKYKISPYMRLLSGCYLAQLVICLFAANVQLGQRVSEHLVLAAFIVPIFFNKNISAGY